MAIKTKKRKNMKNKTKTKTNILCKTKKLSGGGWFTKPNFMKSRKTHMSKSTDSLNKFGNVQHPSIDLVRRTLSTLPTKHLYHPELPKHLIQGPNIEKDFLETQRVLSTADERYANDIRSFLEKRSSKKTMNFLSQIAPKVPMVPIVPNKSSGVYVSHYYGGEPVHAKVDATGKIIYLEN